MTCNEYVMSLYRGYLHEHKYPYFGVNTPYLTLEQFVESKRYKEWVGKDIQQVAEAARSIGYAVVVYTPKELGGSGCTGSEAEDALLGFFAERYSD